MSHYSKESIASHYAAQSGRKLEKLLGKGQFGEAYLLDDNRVVKLTNDMSEVLASAYVQQQPSDALVEVSHIEKVSTDLYLIEQERVLHNQELNGRCDEMFWALSHAADRAGYDIHEMFEEMSIEDVILMVADPDVSELTVKVKAAIAYFDKQGVPGMVVDLASDNFGFREDGSIALFDSRVSALSPKEARQALATQFPEITNDIRPKLKADNGLGM